MQLVFFHAIGLFYESFLNLDSCEDFLNNI